MTPYPSGTTTGSGTGPGKKDGTGTGAVGVPKGKGTGSGGLGGAAKAGNTGQDAATSVPETLITSYADEIGDNLGSVIDESDWRGARAYPINTSKTCNERLVARPNSYTLTVEWIRKDNPSLTADMSYAGGALPLTDARYHGCTVADYDRTRPSHECQLFKVKRQETPKPLRSARRNGQPSGNISLNITACCFLITAGGGSNEKSFANIVENELRQVFPEYPLTTLDNLRLDIFRCYFELTKTPIGGSVFWGTGYKGGNHKWRHLKGIFVPGKARQRSSRCYLLSLRLSM